MDMLQFWTWRKGLMTGLAVGEAGKGLGVGTLKYVKIGFYRFSTHFIIFQRVLVLPLPSFTPLPALSSDPCAKPKIITCPFMGVLECAVTHPGKTLQISGFQSICHPSENLLETLS